MSLLHPRTYRRLRRLLPRPRWVLLTLAAAVLALADAAAYRRSWGRACDAAAVDLWHRLRGPVAPPDAVALVAIDEDSYYNLGLSPTDPFPRQLIADLLRDLARAGPSPA